MVVTDLKQYLNSGCWPQSPLGHSLMVLTINGAERKPPLMEVSLYSKQASASTTKPSMTEENAFPVSFNTVVCT